MKYSIITPVYNAFHLMDQYFRTFENQTYKNFELIIVDDCSTDGSYEKLKEYQQNSEIEIKLKNTDKNLGPGSARNLGMGIAGGEWLLFADADDYVENNFLEEIDAIVKRYSDINCVVYDHYIDYANGKRSIGHAIYKKQEGVVELSQCIRSVRNHVIGKVYKAKNCRENDILFPELKRCEDVAFVLRAIDACKSIYYLKKPLYHYCQRSGSLSNTIDLDETDMLKAYQVLEHTLGSRYQEELKEKSIVDLLYGSILMMCKAQKKEKEILDFIDKYEEENPFWEKQKIIQEIERPKKAFLKMVKKRNILALRGLAWAHSRILRGGGFNIRHYPSA